MISSIGLGSLWWSFRTFEYTVVKQTWCKLSFAHTTVTSHSILTVEAKLTFGKIVVPFALVICDIF